MITSKSEEIDKVLGPRNRRRRIISRSLLASANCWHALKPYFAGPSAFRMTPMPRMLSCVTKTCILMWAWRIVELDGERIELSPKEFDLLVYLASHPGKTYSRMQLLNQIWGYEFEGFEHTVNSHIKPVALEN